MIYFKRSILTFIACLFLFGMASIVLAKEPRVEVRVAQDVIVRNDCQLVLVTVANDSNSAIVLDEPLDQLACGPQFDLRREGTRFDQVSGVFQLRESCFDPEAKQGIPAGEVIAEYLLLSAKRNGERLFGQSGTYELRASVGVDGKRIWSKPKTFEVAKDAQIDFRNKESAAMLREIIRSPLPAELGNREEVLAKIPRESLVSKLGTLGNEALQFVRMPEERKEVWIKARRRQPTLIADFISIRIGGVFASQGKNELAIEEIRRMAIESLEARAYRESCEEKLKGK